MNIKLTLLLPAMLVLAACEEVPGEDGPLETEVEQTEETAS